MNSGCGVDEGGVKAFLFVGEDIRGYAGSLTYGEKKEEDMDIYQRLNYLLLSLEFDKNHNNLILLRQPGKESRSQDLGNTSSQSLGCG